ncbi:P-loop NTPase fold protein [Stenotrophobium rhamnosiphilum]|uniref:KAP P-loop protein n=1 Tax=Stenotrophobium rhamnosiphilum TaxID=2029166 RepID=A0A2T5MC36_9GAMM|nr:P-loop NTPase fold protein [Stenotrophobium rhamnosiphilum]PTU30132.1 KAP P-loop protein [Stenotrophobium rhamnosiphilum]
MTKASSEMKIPELMVFVRVFCIWFVAIEVFRISYYIGGSVVPHLDHVCLYLKVIGIILALVLCMAYAYKRDTAKYLSLLKQSFRVDLLLIAIIGIWVNVLISHSLGQFHEFIKDYMQGASPWSAPTLLFTLILLLAAPLVRSYRPQNEDVVPQLYFLSDDEIEDKSEDILKSDDQAIDFAKTVLASGAHTGLVFGVDGPWGVGKTSFINLAEKYWEKEGGESVIVFRFEPLRYANDPDLPERFIRDLSLAIQKKVFAPEFRSAASRYSKMLKGKAEFSFFGFKLELEPSNETIDDLLDGIDDVLKRVDRRVIVVVDDLDRLEAKMVNNVLFTVRRTFNLSQATYILCYDTECLVSDQNGQDRNKQNDEERSRAREFLEKFLTVKISLFVDTHELVRFLKTEWRQDERHFQSIPSRTMLQLSSLLSEIAEMLQSDIAAQYIPLVGNLRKIKRFVNSALLVKFGDFDIGSTDFNRRDLVNLMLLHLNYPGLFRNIYREESEGRKGIYSVYRFDDSSKVKFCNHSKYEGEVEKAEPSARFLLGQLFDVKVLEIEDSDDLDEGALSSRACFNEKNSRNLETYLELIVRFRRPELEKTFKLYQRAVERVMREGVSIASIFSRPEFDLHRGEFSHDQFWRVLLSNSNEFTKSVADDAIVTLLEYLPLYSSVDTKNEGLRRQSIYSLIRILDRAGWDKKQGRRLDNSNKSIVEIAERIYGERQYVGRGILQSLASEDRGALGWYDLMLFRLQCSADRLGQIYNVHSALILHENIQAPTSGQQASQLATSGMRIISQKIFQLFKSTYIDKKKNFLHEVDATPSEKFYGNSGKWLVEQFSDSENNYRREDHVLIARTSVKSFVIYQLSNRNKPTGSGVGCGLYDVSGTKDLGGISVAMNKYVFGICFNPLISEENIYTFADYCLYNLSNSFFSMMNDEGYVPTEAGLTSGLDADELKKYWKKFRSRILKKNLYGMDRKVVTHGYIATYAQDLPKVFVVLDEMTKAMRKRSKK